MAEPGVPAPSRRTAGLLACAGAACAAVLAGCSTYNSNTAGRRQPARPVQLPAGRSGRSRGGQLRRGGAAGPPALARPPTSRWAAARSWPTRRS